MSSSGLERSLRYRHLDRSVCSIGGEYNDCTPVVAKEAPTV
ncbi:hypothetical protein RSSM_00151 [Rhodopirellula sallentina SM41]|uniref:Uncharacterized protein n=1 Tax=Rhodopirellula sallentina SM41 TaxID=1263870 RepID=M5UAU7_9BACT|nr:hypothetical protein RSSM_00151 [Rhodopirellula sallentina SM41]